MLTIQRVAIANEAYRFGDDLFSRTNFLVILFGDWLNFLEYFNGSGLFF